MTASSRRLRPAYTGAAVEPFLPMIADGSIDPAADPLIFNHIAGCDHCQDALARHDLIGLALAGDRPAGQVRSMVRFVLPMPLIAAAAAAIIAIAGLVLYVHGRQSATSGNALATASLQRIDREVIRVANPDAEPGHFYYVVVQGGQAVLVDPRVGDGDGR